MGIGQKFEKSTQEGQEVSVSETQAEAPKTLKEIGEERRMAVIEGGKKKWEGFKESLTNGKAWLKGKTKDAAAYALASPDAVAMGAKKVGQAGVEVGNKMAEGAGYVADKFFDGAEALEARGKAVYENLSGRVNGAKNKFRDYFIQQKMNKLDQEENLHRGKLEALQRRIDEIRIKKQELISQIV
jgi:hypothetical protein